MTEQKPNQQHQALIEHLGDLKRCVARSFMAVGICFVVCLHYSEYLFELIRAPIQPYLQAGGLVFTAPMDKFIAHLKVAALGGVIVATPVWTYQIWKFVAPGLYDKERKYGLSFMVSGTVLFMTGVSFVYFLVFPMAFKYLMSFGGTVDQPMITISEYLSFFVTTTLIFGAAFELPLVLVLLALMGLIDEQFLRSRRRFAIVILAIISAVITPPDALSMVMMLAPLIILYEASIIVIRIIHQKQAA